MNPSHAAVPFNPYVGPRTFTEAEGRYFFGREREARDLTARIVSERLLLFYAQSGAGKSSLLNARVIPRLRDEERFQVLPVGRVSGELPEGVAQVENIFAFNLMTSLDQSGEHPRRLAQVTLGDFLAGLARETVAGPEGERVARWAYRPELVAAQTATPAAAAARGPRFALVVDQFEEIITGHPGRWQEREGFFRQLNQALLADPNLWVVLSLREDYVASLDPYAELLFNRLRARFYMERMGVAAALEAVRRPAELGGRPFAAGVAEQLVDNLRQVRVPGQEATVPGQYMEPVQLQVVCYQLWENLVGATLRGRPEDPTHQSDVEITFADLARAGDVDKALTQFYEETLALALADPAAAGVSERQVRAWFDEKLITEAGTRGLVHQGESETAGLPNGVARALQKRFLVRAEARGGDTWIELVHDRFVEPIRANNAAWFAGHLSALQRQAALWVEQGRSPGLLLRDAALAEAEEWAAAHPAEVGEAEQQFLESCRQAQQSLERERRDSRRIRLLALAAAAVALIAIVAAFFGVTGQREARTAEATAVAEATRALNAEATAQANANLAATRETDAIAAQATAEAEGVRADEKAREAKAAARRARAGELAAKAQVEMAKQVPDPSIALLLAREAVNTTWTSDGYVQEDTSMALLRALETAPPWIMNLPGKDVNSAVFSPDGSRILTAGCDVRDEDVNCTKGTARVWELATGQVLLTLDDHGCGKEWPHCAVVTARYNPIGSQIVTVGGDGVAVVWDALTGKRVSVVDNPSATVSSAVFSPSGEQILTAGCAQTDPQNICNAGSADVWDVSSGELRSSLKHESEVRSASYSPDGLRVLTVSWRDGKARVWDIASEKELFALGGDDVPIESASYSPDGERIATLNCDGPNRSDCRLIWVRLWDVANGALLWRKPGHTGHGTGASVAFSPDGFQIVTTSDDGAARVWDAATGDQVLMLNDPASGRMYSAAFSPNSKQIVTSGYAEVKLWDASPSRIPITIIAHDEPLSSLDFSSDGQRLLTSSWGFSPKIWPVHESDQPLILQGHTGSVASARFSPDDKRIATASIDGTARIWDSSSGQSLLVLEHGCDAYDSCGVEDASFSPDGARVITSGDDGTVKIWDATTGQLLQTLMWHQDLVTSASFSPDETLIVTADRSGIVTLWDANTDSQIRSFEVGFTAAFSPASDRIVTGDFAGTVAVSDILTGEKLWSTAGHDDLVWSVEYSPDGQTIASASRDGTVKHWSAASGSLLFTYDGHDCVSEGCDVTSATFSPDGRYIASGGYDGEVRIWPGTLEELMELADSLIQRDPPVMTLEERQ